MKLKILCVVVLLARIVQVAKAEVIGGDPDGGPSASSDATQTIDPVQTPIPAPGPKS